MRLQDMFPFNETLVGLNDLFTRAGSDSFYINSLCVKAKDQRISIGKTYLIFKTTPSNGINVFAVELLDVYYHDHYVYLFVQDLLTQKHFLVNHYMDKGETPCEWMLVDLNYYLEKVKTISHSEKK